MGTTLVACARRGQTVLSETSRSRSLERLRGDIITLVLREARDVHVIRRNRPAGHVGRARVLQGQRVLRGSLYRRYRPGPMRSTSQYRQWGAWAHMYDIR